MRREADETKLDRTVCPILSSASLPPNRVAYKSAAYPFGQTSQVKLVPWSSCFWSQFNIHVAQFSPFSRPFIPTPILHLPIIPNFIYFPHSSLLLLLFSTPDSPAGKTDTPDQHLHLLHQLALLHLSTSLALHGVHLDAAAVPHHGVHCRRHRGALAADEALAGRGRGRWLRRAGEGGRGAGQLVIRRSRPAWNGDAGTSGSRRERCMGMIEGRVKHPGWRTGVEDWGERRRTVVSMLKVGY